LNTHVKIKSRGKKCAIPIPALHTFPSKRLHISIENSSIVGIRSQQGIALFFLKSAWQPLKRGAVIHLTMADNSVEENYSISKSNSIC
jgi:hypothetical protein